MPAYVYTDSTFVRLQIEKKILAEIEKNPEKVTTWINVAILEKLERDCKEVSNEPIK